MLLSMDDAMISHQLALLFMVLAIGSLMDIKRPAYNIDSERYHQLARAALFQSAIFEEPTISAVQALVSQASPFRPILSLPSRQGVSYSIYLRPSASPPHTDKQMLFRGL